MDRLDSTARSALMRAVRRQDTTPELRVRRLAHRLGLRFRLHRHDLPGTPDMVFPRRRIALFVHGCFWHRHSGCRYATMPATRREFWEAKFTANQARDCRQAERLGSLGWRVVVVWECETRLLQKLEARLRALFALPSAPRES